MKHASYDCDALGECKARKFHPDLLLIDTHSAISGLSMVVHVLGFKSLKNDPGMEILIDGRERAHHNMARQRDDSKQEKIKPSHDNTCRHNMTSKCSAKIDLIYCSNLLILIFTLI